MDTGSGCQFIQFVLGDVPKRRMTKIMRESRCFRNIGVKPANRVYVIGLFSEKSLCNAPRDLRNLERVRETIVKNVALLGRYHLRDFC